MPHKTTVYNTFKIWTLTWITCKPPWESWMLLPHPLPPVHVLPQPNILYFAPNTSSPLFWELPRVLKCFATFDIPWTCLLCCQCPYTSLLRKHDNFRSWWPNLTEATRSQLSFSGKNYLTMSRTLCLQRKTLPSIYDDLISLSSWTDVWL